MEDLLVMRRIGKCDWDQRLPQVYVPLPLEKISGQSEANLTGQPGCEGEDWGLSLVSWGCSALEAEGWRLEAHAPPLARVWPGELGSRLQGKERAELAFPWSGPVVRGTSLTWRGATGGELGARSPRDKRLTSPQGLLNKCVFVQVPPSDDPGGNMGERASLYVPSLLYYFCSCQGGNFMLLWASPYPLSPLMPQTHAGGTPAHN